MRHSDSDLRLTALRSPRTALIIRSTNAAIAKAKPRASGDSALPGRTLKGSKIIHLFCKFTSAPEAPSFGRADVAAGFTRLIGSPAR
jgi:hypothetical protein